MLRFLASLLDELDCLYEIRIKFRLIPVVRIASLHAMEENISMFIFYGWIEHVIKECVELV
jgi:hypothetical protein